VNSAEKSIWKALPSAPAGTSAPSFRLKGQSQAARFIYPNAQGGIAGIVCRYDLADGTSERITLAWCQDQTGKNAWRPKAILEPRPLYGLANLTDTFAIVADSEEAADAIAAAGFPSVAFAGGPGAVMKSDVSPLAGMVLIFWVSNEAKPGLADALAHVACDLRTVGIPEGKPDGWNATAADSEEIAAAIRNAVVIEPPVDEQAESEPDTSDPVKRFFYDGSRYYLDTFREFVPMDQKSVSRHMKGWTLDREETDIALCEIQTGQFIHFAGPLAGHPRGIHNVGGSKLLATVSPVIIKAKPGQWEILRAVIEGLLDDPATGKTQVETFLAWLKIARESLVTNRRRPGQAIALAGPRGSGKSLLIDITEAALGGRRANPYPYFTGRTNFNGDLAGAELLAVDDEAGSTDIRSRRTLAANIKSCLFSGAVRIEGKHKTAFTFRPCWRMLLALNDEPEALLVLPPITEDIFDKITLFLCHKRPLPMPAHTLEEREAFFATLLSELPGMLAWLERWEIPSEITEERCGVRWFHHPAILAALNELSPEGQLLALIDAANAGGQLPLPWIGTAADLKCILCHAVTIGRDAEKLLGSWAPATGTYLARIDGGRVERLTVRDGIQRWQIKSSGAVD
jgi:hypothetical protein